MSAYSDWRVPELRREFRRRKIRGCIGSGYVNKDTIIKFLREYDRINSNNIGPNTSIKYGSETPLVSIRPNIGTIKPTIQHNFGTIRSPVKPNFSAIKPTIQHNFGTIRSPVKANFSTIR